ncbi:MAG: epoxyqueuosine reductase QueH, partial [Clostridia bacterium]|nr:epoxyqueuosine reductase QueH [Clostridia bacterium]
YKNAHWLNAIGVRLGEGVGVPYLISDFKKNGGYARSIVLSEEYGLYRQNWCGCIYSKMASENV